MASYPQDVSVIIEPLRTICWPIVVVHLLHSWNMDYIFPRQLVQHLKILSELASRSVQLNSSKFTKEFFF